MWYLWRIRLSCTRYVCTYRCRHTDTHFNSQTGRQIDRINYLHTHAYPTNAPLYPFIRSCNDTLMNKKTQTCVLHKLDALSEIVKTFECPSFLSHFFFNITLISIFVSYCSATAYSINFLFFYFFCVFFLFTFY